jgi:dipeptidyl aminopeptidase/acylaminoacyl peptidase
VRALLTALLAWLCTAAASAAGADLDALFAPSSFTAVSLSPDGKRLAAIRFDGVASALLLLDAKTLVARTLIERPGPQASARSPQQIAWIDDQRLAVDYDDLSSEAIDLDGKRLQRLGERFLHTRRDHGAATDWVLAFETLRDGRISRVNLRSGERRPLPIALPGRVIHCAFDNDGALRAVTMLATTFWRGETRVSNWYRVDEDAPWQLLEASAVTADMWVPVQVPAEPNTLIVRSYHQRDHAGLFRYDTLNHRHLEPVAGQPDDEVLTTSALGQSGISRVITGGAKPHSHWFEPRWSLLQQQVDAAIPGRINLLSGDPAGRLLVFSYGDVDPGRWFVYDTHDASRWQVGEIKPRIDPAAMRPRQTLEYAAADGLPIPAYLTRPADADAATPLPLVVLVHGGPHMRDDWLWNEEVQLLAASGYAVFQPQFRGSTGFGQRFEEAGYGQWGRAMQDDVTAGVQHLIAEKIADPARICIVGASYGGYAALWGLVKTPDLYRCGISFAGVSDLELMLNDRSDRNADPAIRELQRLRIGDLAQGKAFFDDVSPLHQVERIRAPLLLAHGLDDQRVPLVHGQRMADALAAQGKSVEWMTFDGEGHGLAYTASKRRYYRAMLDFLQRHIGPDGARKSGFAPPA